MVAQATPTQRAWSGDEQQWLTPTRLIDCQAPAIQRTAERIVADAGATTDVDKARALFSFVRDDIRFGLPPQFDNLPATAVLSQKVGFCNPKGTLFVALLRAAGIPARQHMVSINMNVLNGFGIPGGIYGDHALTEVFLDGKWVKTDAYVVDKALFDAAQSKAQSAGVVMGFGVHEKGTCEWDGRNDAFVQYVMPPEQSATSAAAAAAAAAAERGEPLQHSGSPASLGSPISEARRLTPETLPLPSMRLPHDDPMHLAPADAVA